MGVLFRPVGGKPDKTWGNMARIGRRIGAAVLAAAVLLLVAVWPASALILLPGDAGVPAGQRPADGVLGRWETNASCVVIDPNYVLTTRHQISGGVGGTVTINGTAYTVAEVFTHPEADLQIARLTLAGNPANLTDYARAYKATGFSDTQRVAVIGGYGRSRDTTLSNSGGDYGYTWLSEGNATLRWGQNYVEAGTGSATSGPYTSQVVRADFDGPADGPLAHEAATAQYDSGGGWFIQESGQWWTMALSAYVDPRTPYGESWFRDGTQNPPTLPGDTLQPIRVAYYWSWIDGVTSRATWSNSSGGAWGTAANWQGDVPNATDKWAVFGDAVTTSQTVTIESTKTVGKIIFDSAGNYTIARSGSAGLSLDVSSATPDAYIEINNTKGNGAHTITAPITLYNNLVLTQNSGGDFTLAGAVGQVGVIDKRSITKRGPGTLVLAAANTYTGGTVIEQGTLRVDPTGDLSTGSVTLSGGALDLRRDASDTFSNTFNVQANTSLNVGGGGSGTITLNTLTVTGNQTLTVTGAPGYSLDVTKQVPFNSVTTTATVNTSSADVTFWAGVKLPAGTLRKTGPRTLTVAGTASKQVFASGTGLQVSGGTLVLNADVGGSAGARNVNLSVDAAGAEARFGAAQHLASLSVTGGGGATLLNAASPTLLTQALTIDTANSWLDLGRNNLIVDYTGGSPQETILGYVRSGLNADHGGYWDGTGIRSTDAAANSLTAVAVVDNADLLFTSFGGMDVDPTSVLVKYTYVGDNNLDGIVDWENDFLAFQNGVLFGIKNNNNWLCGDYNYDGVVDWENDFLAFQNGLLFQGSPLSGGLLEGAGALLAAPEGILLGLDGAGGLDAVPEPATLALLGLGVAVALRRRRARATACPKANTHG
jgi:autotransporter-associated beta strand protein